MLSQLHAQFPSSCPKMIISAFLFSLVASSVLCSDVIELGDSDFEGGVKDKEIMLVEFFAPWCGHCKRLAPEYETAATSLKREDPPVHLAKVDCTESGKDTCSKFGVSGYPTLKIFRNGQFSSEYDGPRESSGIVSYMRKQAGPSSKEITDLEKMKSFVSGFEPAIVGFFDQNDSLRKEFMKTADELREKHRFAHTSSEEVMTEFGHKDEIVLFRPPRLHSKFESNKEAYTGTADIFYIKKFLNMYVHGLVGHMTPDNQDQFKKPLCVVYYNVDYQLNPKGTNYWRNRVIKVARNLKGKVLNFAIAKNSEFSRDLESFGLNADSDNPVVTIKSDDGSKYAMKDKFSVDTFNAFLDDYFGGKLKPYIKSEPVPETNDGPVKVVVGETFEDIVNDESKDVLIEFYAPWCGHCKSLEPVYKELAEKFKDVEDIVIAKMDATANDVPSPYQVEGFPTLYFAPMKSKQSPKKYQGGRDVSSFKEFLQREATNTFTLPDEDKDKKKKKKKSKKEKDEL